MRRAEFLAGSTVSALAARGAALGAAPAPFYVLVLSGGGALGAYEAGVLSALPALGIDYDVVCGTSIGALNGALFATGQLTRLTHLWGSIAQRTVVALPQALRPTASTPLLARPLVVVHRWLQAAVGNVQGVYSAEPIRAIVREMLLTPEGDRVVPFRKPLFWAVTDLSDLCGAYYYQEAVRPSVAVESVRRGLGQRGITLRSLAPSEPGAFVEALRASAAIPAFFEPAAIGSDVFVDGGVVNNTPFDVAKVARNLFGPGRPLEIHVVFNSPRERSLSAGETKNAFSILLACYDVMQKRLVDDGARLTLREAELARRIHSSGAAATMDARLRDAADVTIHAIRPSSMLRGSVLDFSQQAVIDDNFRRGARDAAAGWQPYSIPAELCALGPA